jgi:hypothetical protein
VARQVLNLFSAPPANHPPAVWFRRVDTALLAGALVFSVFYAVIGWLTWHTVFGNTAPDGGCFSQLIGYPALLLSELTGGHLFQHAAVDNPAYGSLLPLHLRLLPTLLLSLGAGGAVFASSLTPTRRMVWVEGPRLLDGVEAEAKGLQTCQAELAGADPFISLAPRLPMAKTRLTRGILMVGSPGAGKTVVLLRLIKQMIDRNHRALIYDVKKDMTSYFAGMHGTVGLLSPWDGRRENLVWDIARDCRTPADADALAASFIPTNDKDPFWTNSARMLFSGTVRSLQDQYGISWGWDLLAERLNADIETFAECMEVHYPKAKALIADAKSQAANSILSTLSSFTALVDQLAAAWGDGRDRAGNPRPSLSFKAWAADGYPGKIRQIVMQSGPDKHSTAAFSSAIINLLTPTLLALPDDEKNRTIGIFLDELPSIGKIDFPALLERGRSAGIHLCATCQDFSQIESVWGVHVRKTLLSMFGTQIIFRMSASGSRQEIADNFGKAKWSVTAYNTADGGKVSTSVHEENQAVVPGYAIGELGPFKRKKTKKQPIDWGVSAMVALSASGGDVLTLDFDGLSLPKRRTPFKPARWTRGPGSPGVNPEPDLAERRMMERDETAKAAEMDREIEDAKAALLAEAAAKETERAAMQSAGGVEYAAEQADWSAARDGPEDFDASAPTASLKTTARERLLAGAKQSPLAQLGDKR